MHPYEMPLGIEETSLVTRSKDHTKVWSFSFLPKGSNNLIQQSGGLLGIAPYMFFINEPQRQSDGAAVAYCIVSYRNSKEMLTGSVW